MIVFKCIIYIKYYNFFYSEIDIAKSPIKEKEHAYLNLSNDKPENYLLLAVENQDNDFLYTNSAKDKEKASPAKLNVFKIFNCNIFLKK